MVAFKVLIYASVFVVIYALMIIHKYSKWLNHVFNGPKTGWLSIKSIKVSL